VNKHHGEAHIDERGVGAARPSTSALVLPPPPAEGRLRERVSNEHERRKLAGPYLINPAASHRKEEHMWMLLCRRRRWEERKAATSFSPSDTASARAGIRHEHGGTSKESALF
jgi:hypothetical protein